MLKNVLACILCSFFLYACKKSENTGCNTVLGYPTTSEVDNLRNYITNNSIPATEDPRGFFYNVTFSGTGAESPTGADSVTIKYKGKLTNGTVFDSTATGATRKFLLSNLIIGWQYGLPLIRKNGIIDLYLPPALGYGCLSFPNLPANSITIFHVELTDF